MADNPLPRLGKLNRRASSLREMAYLKIRDAILQGHLEPGMMLSEEQLAAELDISRTPLREALAKLEQDRLVDSIPHRGRFVASLTNREVAQILGVRIVLEAYAIALAIHLIPREEITRVVQFVEEHRSLLYQGDYEAHIQCNREVHGLAPRYSGNQVLEEIILNLDQRVARYFVAREGVGPHHMIRSADEHLGILKAYRERDGAKASDLMTRHLELSHGRGRHYRIQAPPEEYGS